VVWSPLLVLGLPAALLDAVDTPPPPNLANLCTLVSGGDQQRYLHQQTSFPGGVEPRNARGWQRGSYQLGSGGGSLAEAQLWWQQQPVRECSGSMAAATATRHWQQQRGVGGGSDSGDSMGSSPAAAEAARHRWRQRGSAAAVRRWQAAQ
jgi:hypothetical protein